MPCIHVLLRPNKHVRSLTGRRIVFVLVAILVNKAQKLQRRELRKDILLVLLRVQMALACQMTLAGIEPERHRSR